jgi:hypothetical protein
MITIILSKSGKFVSDPYLFAILSLILAEKVSQDESFFSIGVSTLLSTQADGRSGLIFSSIIFI